MFKITEPCSRRWTDLPGDERRRYCGECGYVAGEPSGPTQSRRAVMAGVVLTTISPLLAQDGRVRVVVTDASGAPVQRATVRIGQRHSMTDEMGSVTFVGLAAGKAEVVVSGPALGICRGTIDVVNGTELKLYARLEFLAIDAAAVIEPHRGRLLVAVSDPSQGAVAGAEVTIRVGDSDSAKARTDGKGVASFSALPVGDCRVEVRAAGFREWQGAIAVAEYGEGRLEARLEVSDPGTKVAVRPKAAGRRFIDWLSSCARRPG